MRQPGSEPHKSLGDIAREIAERETLPQLQDRLSAAGMIVDLSQSPAAQVSQAFLAALRPLLEKKSADLTEQELVAILGNANKRHAELSQSAQVADSLPAELASGATIKSASRAASREALNSQELAACVETHNIMSMRLFSGLANKADGNFVLSPAMLMGGLSSVLESPRQLSGTDTVQTSHARHLEVLGEVLTASGYKHAVWWNSSPANGEGEGLERIASNMRALRVEDYGKGDFKAAQAAILGHMQAWFKSNGFPNVLPHSIKAEQTLAYQGVYLLKADWARQFDPDLDREMSFTLESGTEVKVKAMLMPNEKFFVFNREKEACMAMMLPFKEDMGGRVVLVKGQGAGLPIESILRWSEQNFKPLSGPKPTSFGWQDFEQRTCNLWLPPIKASQISDLAKAMAGADVIGGERNYLSGSCTTVFRLDHKGVEIKFSMQLRMATAGSPPRPQEWRFDRPFIALVFDRQNLLVGGATIRDPRDCAL